MRLLDPFASRLPWMVAAGNHEIEAGSTKNKPFVAYEHRFRMPAVAPPVSGYKCGKGGGLDGLAFTDAAGGENTCGEGLGADEADAFATAVANKLAADSLVGAGGGGQQAEEEAVARQKDAGAIIRKAARGVRETFGVARSLAPVVGAEEEEISCCPSEWSGTYDYGNR